MKIEIAQHGRMSESGSSLLRLIQNQDMPLLDLLVREAVQNSLDASKGAPFVNVDISIRQFNPTELNKHLEGITDQLNRRFSKPLYNSLIISDSNTVGLTGPVKYSDVKGHDFGNCLKLIYEISKPQLNEGAGGSWGLGKTIYFRLGIGLVIYYSRINVNGRYKSRLAACLVEDETRPDSLIPSSEGVKRGIAWWGASVWGKKETIPIEDEKEILRVLSVFNITPYRRDETGTTIVIPYIDDTKLLQEVYAKNDKTEQKPYWASSVEDYLKIAFQRWYAPRILNASYEGSYLRPSVNSILIKVSDLLPLFRVIRELYICAFTGAAPDESLIAESKAKFQVDNIITREVFMPGSASAGKFAYLKMTNDQLLMAPPNNHKSPYQQITNRVIPMENGNTPIVMFTRKPGMVVGYDFNGAWTHRMPKSGENEYIIGLFVANSANRMADIKDNANNHLSLEEYIRQGEKADHASWSDRTIGGTNPRVISKVQATIIRTIAKEYKEQPVSTIERKNTGLSHALANILLPSEGFGHTPTDTPIVPGGGGGGSKSGKPTITLGNSPIFERGRIIFEFEAMLNKGTYDLQLAIITDYKKYYPDSWEKENEIGKPFPVAFLRVLITGQREGSKKSAWKNLSLALEKSSVTNGVLWLRYIPSETYKINSVVRIASTIKTWIKGTLEITANDPDLKVSVDIREAQK